jgi:hypothetical protein
LRIADHVEGPELLAPGADRVSIIDPSGVPYFSQRRSKRSKGISFIILFAAKFGS